MDSDAIKSDLNLQNETIRETPGGTVRTGSMSVGEVLERVSLPVRPKQPWGDEESHRRWVESHRTGHRHLHCKCQRCGLEFTVLTNRTTEEWPAAYDTTHGKLGGVARKMTCPECGELGTNLVLGQHTEPGSICGFVGRSIRGDK